MDAAAHNETDLKAYILGADEHNGHTRHPWVPKDKKLPEGADIMKRADTAEDGTIVTVVNGRATPGPAVAAKGAVDWRRRYGLHWVLLPLPCKYVKLVGIV